MNSAEITLDYLTDGPPGERKGHLLNPDWQQVRFRICELDGLRKTVVNITNSSSGEELTIGGGLDRYIVSYLRSDGSNGTLVNPDHKHNEDAMELIVGGQSGAFPRKLVVNLYQTLLAAERFLHSESLNLFIWDTAVP